MNKQELVEKAVMDWQGEFKPVCELVYEYLGPSTYSACEPGALFGKKVLFTREEFNAAADRLRGKPDWIEVLEKHPQAQYLAQWPGINDGEKGLWISYDRMPDQSKHGYHVDYGNEVFHYNKGNIIGDWRNTLEKRPEHIGDDKENASSWIGGVLSKVEADMQIPAGMLSGNRKVSNWFERGELPPVGEVVELAEETEFLSLARGNITLIAKGAHCHVVGHAKRPDNNAECITLMSVINPGAGFCTGNHEFLAKPIRTEREKFIEAAGKILNKPEINDNIDAGFTLRQAAEALFDAGFKAPDNKKPD